MPDSASFLKERLKVHRLEYNVVKPKDLVVPAGETYLLAPEDPHMLGVKWVPDIGSKIKVESLDDLKLWMGIPDTDARKRLPVRRSPRVLRGSRIEVAPLVPTRATASMFDVAKDYLVGDSALHAANLTDLQKLVQLKPDMWIPVSLDVTIEHNAQLILGPGVHKYIAGHIKIKTGGQMRVQSGFLKLECRSITGNIP